MSNIYVTQDFVVTRLRFTIYFLQKKIRNANLKYSSLWDNFFLLFLISFFFKVTHDANGGN